MLMTCVPCEVFRLFNPGCMNRMHVTCLAETDGENPQVFVHFYSHLIVRMHEEGIKICRTLMHMYVDYNHFILIHTHEILRIQSYIWTMHTHTHIL
jgi:hypothetical protein